jgi:hypothetical protein
MDYGKFFSGRLFAPDNQEPGLPVLILFDVQMMVMALFTVFWLSFGLLQLPTLELAAAYSATGNAAEGAASKEYNAVIALYLIVWGFALFTFFIFTLKTNVVFALIFLFVSLAAWILAGAYFKVSNGDYTEAGHLQKVSEETSSSVTEPDTHRNSRLVERYSLLWQRWVGT